MELRSKLVFFFFFYYIPNSLSLCFSTLFTHYRWKIFLLILNYLSRIDKFEIIGFSRARGWIMPRAHLRKTYNYTWERENRLVNLVETSQSRFCRATFRGYSSRRCAKSRVYTLFYFSTWSRERDFFCRSRRRRRKNYADYFSLVRKVHLEIFVKSFFFSLFWGDRRNIT